MKTNVLVVTNVITTPNVLGFLNMLEKELSPANVYKLEIRRGKSKNIKTMKKVRKPCPINFVLMSTYFNLMRKKNRIIIKSSVDLDD